MCSLEKAIEKAKQFEFAEKLGRKHTPQVNTVEYKQKQFSDEKKPYLRSSDRGKKEKKKETNGQHLRNSVGYVGTRNVCQEIAPIKKLNLQ